MSKPTYFLSHGFSEGPKHSQLFRQQLNDAGFKQVRRQKKANVIICHSAGCYGIRNTDALYVAINPPFWPHKSIMQSAAQKLWIDYKEHAGKGQLRYVLHKTYLSLRYIITRPSQTLNAGRLASRQNIKHINRHKGCIIRNDEDPWLTPDIGNYVDANKLSIERLPGSHDDCWTNPRPYIAIIKQLLK